MSPAFQQFPDMIEIAIRTEHPGAETLHDQVGELARIPTIALMIGVEVGGSLAIGGSARQEISVKCIELRGQFCGSVGIINALASMLGGVAAGGLTLMVQKLFGERGSWLFAPVGMLLSLSLCLGLLLHSHRLWRGQKA